MKTREVDMPPGSDVKNYYLYAQEQHMCAESLRYYDIFKRVYLLGFLTPNKSGLFDLFSFSDPCFVNSYLIPPLNFFLKFDLILI